MPTFTARPAPGSVTTKTWTDPPEPGVASHVSRISPTVAAAPLRWCIELGSTVEVRASPDGGAEGAPDSELDGKLFRAWFAEKPAASFAFVTPALGVSSLQYFTPDTRGHYTFVFGRTAGGLVVLHFDCE